MPRPPHPTPALGIQVSRAFLISVPRELSVVPNTGPHVLIQALLLAGMALGQVLNYALLSPSVKWG